MTLDHGLTPKHDPQLPSRVAHYPRLISDPHLTPNPDHGFPSRLTSGADQGPQPRVTHGPSLTPVPDSSLRGHCLPQGGRERVAAPTGQP